MSVASLMDHVEADLGLVVSAYQVHVVQTQLIAPSMRIRLLQT